MTETVLSDSQYGIGRLLRPFSTYDSVYQGQSCKRPIQFTEGGVALADSASDVTRDSASDPSLIRGVDVPMGSKILLLLPALVPVPAWQQNALSVGFYRYFLIWRFKSVNEYRESHLLDGYHIDRRAIGAPDAFTKRFLKIAAFSSSSYASAEPLPPTLSSLEGGYPLATVDDTIQTIKMLATTQDEEDSDDVVVNQWPYMPLIPDGSDGHYQQGVLSNTRGMNKYAPSWIVHETCAKGDELLIGIFRDAPSSNGSVPENLWNFSAGADTDLFDFLNDSKENGIYLFTGTR